MRGEPSANLVHLLARLKLATPAQVQGVAARARRLAGDLGDFESVWVDALAQSRLLTPYQAAEINAGRGDALLHGSYVILHPEGHPQVAACFAARHLDTQRPVRLYVVRQLQCGTEAATEALGQLAAALLPVYGALTAVVEEAGLSGDGVWAVCSAVEGTTAADWMVENGRFPPQIVLQIARAMVERLAELEQVGVVHGDLSAAGLLLQRSGQVALPMPGLRGIVRPSEGYGFGDLQPDAYDYLAPERIGAGTPPSRASDWYACGCLWWHLLTGRPPFPGGNSLAKLKAVHAARIIDVRQFAPEVPEALARAIEKCLARDPAARPQSAMEIGTLLGTVSKTGMSDLASCLSRHAPLWHGPHVSRRRQSRRGRPKMAAVVVTALLLGLVGLWPVWRRGDETSRGEPAVALVKPPAASEASGAKPEVVSPAVDPAITLASATEPDGPEDLVLSADEPLHPADLKLKPGQLVRGRPGQRPRVCVPPAGLAVAGEDVTFQGIDFVSEIVAEPSKPFRPASMIVVAAQTIAFRGCSFSSAADSPPAAVAWVGAETDLPAMGGEVTMRDCVLSGLETVVDCQGEGGLTVELDNSLCVASGPIVRLHEAPSLARPISITLTHTTTRGDSAVLECRYGRIEGESAAISITADDSALDGNPRGGLLVFGGNQRPDGLLKSIRWNGSGSLVTQRTAMAVWRRGAKRQEVLPEDELDVAGLVRSEVEFAGSADGPPSASRVIRWQVPLRSADPPGADTNALYLPRL